MVVMTIKIQESEVKGHYKYRILFERGDNKVTSPPLSLDDLWMLKELIINQFNI